MTKRIAVASSDGKVVNRHFGKADKFYIIDLFELDYKYVECRETIPVCNDFEHTEESFNRVATLLSDCSAVYVSRIGIEAQRYLDSKGIQSYELPCFIDDLLTKLRVEQTKL
jgi:predicted Fe-Mo cluster-binding NifX family protein